MFKGIGTPEIILILVVVILLFGAPKLPGLAKSIAESMRVFKKEVKKDGDDKSDKTGDGDKSTEK